MLTKIQKWGNSLAIRIPSAYSHECELEQGSIIEMINKKGQIIIRKAHKSAKQTLVEMLDKVTTKNLHHEVNVGHIQGKEDFDE